MSERFPRRPGNKVVRKRLDAQSIIQLASEKARPGRPTVTGSAQKFVLAVVVIIAVGSLLLMLPFATEEGRGTSFIDALFTSMSAFSVTGLAIVDTGLHWSFFGQLVILVLIQLGGFGFMVGTSLVLIALGRGSTLRANMMVQDGSPTLSLQEASSLSLRILKFMVVSEAIGAVVLTFFFLRTESLLTSIWWGIFHSVSAFCNAGLGLHGNLLSASGQAGSPVFLMTIAGLIQLGALSYMVLADVWRHRSWKPLALDSKLVLITNVIVIGVSTVVFMAVEWNSALRDLNNGMKPVNALFEAVASRTSGFSSIDWSQATDSSQFLWIAIMMIGGAAGSTTGGVKLATIAVIIMAVVSTVRGQADPQAFGRRVASQIVFRAMSIIAMFISTHFLLSLLLVMTEDVFGSGDFSFLSLMFEAMSALATTGLSTGITADLSIAGKTVLIIGMFIGRLGPITVAFALQNRQKRERFRYAEASIRIG